MCEIMRCAIFFFFCCHIFASTRARRESLRRPKRSANMLSEYMGKRRERGTEADPLSSLPPPSGGLSVSIPRRATPKKKRESCIFHHAKWNYCTVSKKKIRMQKDFHIHMQKIRTDKRLCGFRSTFRLPFL